MMRYLLLIFSISLAFSTLGQTPDNAPWSPAGAVWVYREFSATTNRSLLISYIKDTMIAGRTAKKMENRRVEFIDINLSVRIETILGYDYYLNSNDSVFLWEENAFRFIYDFTPSVADQWIVGTKKITCPSTFPLSDTIKVDSIKQVVLGSSLFSVTYNDSYSRNYLLGPVVKNIGPLTGPYPFINRNRCNLSSGFFEGLICYRDGIRGPVNLANSTPAFCHSVITSLDIPDHAGDKNSSLYPNPAQSMLRISDVGSNVLRLDYSIVDAAGREVSKGVYTEDGIPVSVLRPGIYFLRLAGRHSSTEVLKFMIAR